MAQTIGDIRRVDKFLAIDSFGVVSRVTPVIDKSADKHGWEVFTLSPSGAADGRLFYLPNTLYHALEIDPVEKVNFFRDEMANLVWAVEESYESAPGDVINRNDEESGMSFESEQAVYYWATFTQTLVPYKYVMDEGVPGNTRYIGPVAHYLA